MDINRAGLEEVSSLAKLAVLLWPEHQAEALEQEFFKRGFTRTAVKALPESFLSQGTRSEICEATGLDPRSLAECAYKVVYKK